MAEKIKRSLFRSFINTGTVMSPDYELINLGITEASIQMNPKTSEEVYIHLDGAEISIEAYAPTLPVEGTAYKDDAAFSYLDAMRKARAVMEEAETEVVNVWMYKGDFDGVYLAEKQKVSVQFETFGGDGGQSGKISYSLNYMGDPEVGTFDALSKEFTPINTAALLSSLELTGADKMRPTFKKNRIWYFVETSDATNDITAVAADDTATIEIDADGVTIDNGDPITWAPGLNRVVVTVTADTDVTKYYLLVSKS